RVLEREGRVLVGAECAVAVEADAPGPAKDADVEVEQTPWVAAGEEDREEGDHADYCEADPEEQEHDAVGDREQPLDQPEPAAEPRRELADELKRISGVFCMGEPLCRPIRRRVSVAPRSWLQASSAGCEARSAPTSSSTSRR